VAWVGTAAEQFRNSGPAALLRDPGIWLVFKDLVGIQREIAAFSFVTSARTALLFFFALKNAQLRVLDSSAIGRLAQNLLISKQNGKLPPFESGASFHL